MRAEIIEALTDFEKWVWLHHSGTSNAEKSAKEAWDHQQQKIDKLIKILLEMP